MLLAHVGKKEQSEFLSRAIDKAASVLICDGTASGAKARDFADAVIAAL